jgi:hypothetical protein
LRASRAFEGDDEADDGKEVLGGEVNCIDAEAEVKNADDVAGDDEEEDDDDKDDGDDAALDARRRSAAAAAAFRFASADSAACGGLRSDADDDDDEDEDDDDDDRCDKATRATEDGDNKAGRDNANEVADADVEEEDDDDDDGGDGPRMGEAGCEAYGFGYACLLRCNAAASAALAMDSADEALECAA